MTDSEQLQAIKSQILTRISEVLAQKKPSYKSATGMSVDWTSYLRELRQQLKEVNTMLVAENPMYEETQLVTPDDPLA